MSSRYTSGKYAIAECDRCGFRYKLKQLRKEIIKQKEWNIRVCPICWEPDQPQLSLGLYPIYDPQAVLEPRPDVSYYNSGPDNNNMTGPGSRVIQWGWAPVGGARDGGLTPNNLAMQSQISSVLF